MTIKSEMQTGISRTEKKWLLTDRQREVLATISRLTQAHHRSPSIREIAEAIGVVSTNTVAYHLDRLETKGYIVRDHFISRSIHILN